jgi:hypothetical protein
MQLKQQQRQLAPRSFSARTASNLPQRKHKLQSRLKKRLHSQPFQTVLSPFFIRWQHRIALFALEVNATKNINKCLNLIF